MSTSETIRAQRRAKVKRVAEAYGVKLAEAAVCPGHSAPLDFATAWICERPALSVTHGPRGGGKSYTAGLATHIDSIRYDRHKTKILGGSLAQSQQIYNALDDFRKHRSGSLRRFRKTSAEYLTGSEVSILAASATSVRGPHVATLRLDEVDEIPEDLRESAVGMCMEQHGVRASICMTSTWHRVAGPMEKLRDQAGEQGIAWYTFCAFEVLERCPETRSGPRLEHCPECPLMPWCHEGGTPKAKLSDGHYSIEALIQKIRLVSKRVFESDYLCRKPKADGVWFPTFAEETHVTELAEYNPRLPVRVAVDSGVFTGAVAFQVLPAVNGGLPTVSVFWDFLSEGWTARASAAAIVAGLAGRNGIKRRVSTDPAGGARTAIGPTVLGEYAAAGLSAEAWPLCSIADSLATLEALISPAEGRPRLIVHPRCRQLVAALQSYRRAKLRGQWQDYPADPQHPDEDLVDALRGGLRSEFPEGFKAGPKLESRPLRRILY